MSEQNLNTQARQDIAAAQRWVIKIGSSLVTADGAGLDHDAIRRWGAEVAQLRALGKEVILVSSGAVAEGMARMGWSSRPADLANLQAAAALGQMGLVQAYESVFKEHGLLTAQILLTHDDVANRKRYLNARSTIRALLNLGVIPIVNENDTVATNEIKLGDNDSLGSLVANLVGAQALIILTDQQGMFDADPRKNPDAKLIEAAKVNQPELLEMAGGGAGALGRGGMLTKVLAAQRAAHSGASTVIACGREENALVRIAQGETLGTVMMPAEAALSEHKLWLAGQLQVAGEIVLDDGAVAAVVEHGASILPVGVTKVTGDFKRGDMVRCVDLAGNELARGLTNYKSSDAVRIVGLHKAEIAEVLDVVSDDELIHRDNLLVS